MSNLEVRVVAEVVTRIASSPNLSPEIQTGDRTPFTDGHIDIYDGPDHLKANFQGRVDVQVKGRSQRSPKARVSKFSIDIADLQAYRRIKGVVYFLVLVDKSSKKKQIFYVILDPPKISGILSRVGPKQKTVSVEMTRFPIEPAKITAIMQVALARQLQTVISSDGSELLDEATSLTVVSVEPLNFSQPITLEEEQNEFALYATLPNSKQVLLSGSLTLTPGSYLARPFEHPVKSGATHYDDVLIKQVSEESIQLSLGPCLRILIQKASRVGTIHLEAKGSFKEQLKALTFYKNIATTRQFYISEHEFSFNFVEEHTLDRVSAQIVSLEKIIETFSHLNSNCDLIDPETVTQKQVQQIVDLHRTLVDGAPVAQAFDRGGRVRQPFGNYWFELICIQQQDPKLFKYTDLFDTNEQRIYARSVETSDDQTPYAVTAFELLGPEALIETLNLNLNSIVEAYSNRPRSEQLLTDAQQTVLKLLHCADADRKRRKLFLTASDSLNSWLIQLDGFTTIHRINQWQIKARLDSLSALDRDEIRALRASTQGSPDELGVFYPLSFAILLGEDEEGTFQHSLLDAKEREVFESWPIWNLYRAKPIE